LVARQPATDGLPSHREPSPYGVESGPTTLPSWRSRARSAGWLSLLIIGLGAVAALTVAFVAVVVWAFVSSALT
jgi:hypothetical protein